MSADLPTEEDVLAALVLAKAFDPPLLVFDVPGIVAEIAYHRHRAAGESWSAAIADSERRLEVERARDAVLHLARNMGAFLTDRACVQYMAQAADRLAAAEAEVSRYGG